MNIRKSATLFITTAVIVISCSSRPEARMTKHTFDTETDCLNGTMIVSLDGRYGLADTCGKEILAPVYDDIYYISDEIAAAFTGQTVGFFDRNGKRLGEAMMEDKTAFEDVLEAYSKIEKTRMEQWDSILTGYEELRKYCQSDRASAETARLMADDIRTALQKVGGQMEKDQKLRFETERSAYRR